MALEQGDLNLLLTYDPETDLTPANEIRTLLFHPSWVAAKKAPANFNNTFPDWADATEADVLALLGVADVVQSSQLTGFQAAIAGSGLIAETEKTRLSGIIAPQVIVLSAASDVSGKISGATKPDGWTLAASDTDLIITHTVTGKQVSGIIIKEVDGSTKRICVPFEEAYTGITEISTTITIEGINPTSLALIVIIQFV